MELKIRVCMIDETRAAQLTVSELYEKYVQIR